MSIATCGRPVSATQPRPPHPVGVLIVDDDPLMRMIAREVLGMATPIFRLVGEAVDGVSAVAQILDGRPDVVLCDVDMPHLSGPDVVRQVRQQLPDQRFLFWSASAARTLRGLEADLGVPFVTKDNVEQLADSLLAASGGR